MTQKVLWNPDPSTTHHSRLAEYRHWLAHHHQLLIGEYEALWQWSVEHPAFFWESVARFFQVRFHQAYTEVLTGDDMISSKWFTGGTLNYAEQIYTGMQGQDVAIHFANEAGAYRSVSTDEMWREVNRIRQYFLSHGVAPGDRIAGYLPNIPEATFCFLAAASIGAVWSCCSQDFGVSSVVDRFHQIEPVIFIAADGYYYNGKTHPRIEAIQEVQKSLPTVRDTLVISYLKIAEVEKLDTITKYESLPLQDVAEVIFHAVDFSHPLWILYSSGTTGAPKAITHSHGGCLLEHLKYLAFHNDVHRGEVFFWYTTTGWMMWNFLQGSMMMGASIVLYDGSPAYPDPMSMWHLAEKTGINHFGTSAPFLIACMKNGRLPGKEFDLSRLRSIGSTGSPLPPEAFDWVYHSIHKNVWLCSMSGGTDVCTAFVGGVIEKPVIEGEIQCRALGCALYAYDDHASPVIEEVGEMVIAKPMPSMPVYFWNDPDKRKYHSSYFEDIPGVWRHGDWVKITQQGGVIIYGRSDATLNRHGVRIGTAEIYNALNELALIDDSLIVNLELEGGRHYMPLFVKVKSPDTKAEDLKDDISAILRAKCSPRHVPDDVIIVPDIPYTISGKKMEAPVKKILMGLSTENSLNKDAMRNPESLVFFEKFQLPE